MRSLSHILPPLAFWLLLMGMTSPPTPLLRGEGSNFSIPPFPAREGGLDRSQQLTALAIETAAENPQLALQLFDRAIQVAETIDDRATKINTLSEIAVKLAEVGQTNKAKQLFDRAIQLTKRRDENFTLYQQEPAVRDIAIKKAQAGFISEALQLTKTISSKYRQAEALNGIAPILAEKGQLQLARKTLDEALSKAKGITGDYAYESNGSCGNDKFDILSKIAGNLSLLSQFEKALQVAQSVTGCSSADGESGEDYQAFAYLGILAHLANVEQVKQTWTSSQTIPNNIEKVQVWSAIAVKLAAMGEANSAVLAASTISQQIPSITKIESGSDLREFGLKENRLKDIAVKLAEVGEFESAKKVADMIQEPTNEELGKRFTASIKDLTWVEISRQLAKFKQIEPALQTVNSIQDSDAKALGIIAIAQELHATGQATQAERIISQNLQLPAIPNSDDYNANESYVKIISGLATTGQIERSLQLAQSIKTDDFKQEVLANIASQLTDVGQLDRALQIANNLTLSGLKEEAFQKIAAKYLAAGQLEQALQVSQQLSDNPQVDILAKIADAFAKLGQTEKALQIAQSISRQEVKASAIANIAAKLIK